MKKITTLIILFFLTGLPAFTMDFYLKLGGGFSHMAFTNLNRVLSDWETEQILDSQSRPNWDFVGGETGKLKSAFELESELKLDVNPNLAFSFSAGILHSDLPAEKTNLIIDRTLGRYDVIHPIKVSGFPFVFSGYFQLPVWKGTRLYIRAGAGYITARLIEQTGFKQVENTRYAIELDQHAMGSGRIYLGSLGISYQFSQGAVLFLENSYRNSQIQNFENKNQNGGAVLYSYQKYNPGLDLWSAVFRFHDTIPSGENIRSAEKTTVDMSGLSLTLGIMIHF
jgi:hypothetical protein